MIRWLMLVLLCMLPASVVAQDRLDMASLPVLHEGRIKPFDSAARNIVNFLSGSETIDGYSASEWLTHALYDPVFAIRSPIIRVDDTSDLSFLQVTKGLYSAQSLYQRQKETETERLSELLDTKLILIQQIANTLTPYVPISGGDGATLTDILLNAGGSDLPPYIAHLLSQGERNVLLRLIPVQGQSDRMLTPWQVVNGQAIDPSLTPLLKLWQDSAMAWRTQDHTSWLTLRDDIIQKTKERLDASPFVLLFERTLNRLQPLKLSLAFCLLATFAGFVTSRADWLVVGSVCAALSLGFLKMLGRVVILERPPVGTLYESVLFVILLCLLCGLVWAWRYRNRLTLPAIALMVSFLHLLAFAHDSESDNMMMLSAVLNSNFWLSVHVLVITAGYAVCLLCAVYAFLLLVKRAGQDHPLYSLMIKTSLFALALTATGTVLGGIWADQSWGRFWGWDPKENGALLIILWISWILHARISGFFSPLLVLLGFYGLFLCVALSWFGVNLLGVGLHSYGFSEGGFFYLCLFLTLMLLSGIGLTIHYRKGH